MAVEQPNQFKCHTCGRSFSSEDQLREHEKNCTGPRPHGG
jgi:transposase-like protein